jgi:hypothetical protein
MTPWVLRLCCFFKDMGRCVAVWGMWGRSQDEIKTSPLNSGATAD